MRRVGEDPPFAPAGLVANGNLGAVEDVIGLGPGHGDINAPGRFIDLFRDFDICFNEWRLYFTLL
jgi:hypothetical protein